ncbi:homeodomain-like protein [Tanacetum coccineum]
MDAYRDERMGDVIVGEPFLREVGIKAKRFEGIITFYKGDDEVTYQMVRSHLRFKNYTNEQCNKIPPLLKRKADKKMQAKPEKTSKNSGCLKKDRKMALEHDIEDLTKQLAHEESVRTSLEEALNRPNEISESADGRVEGGGRERDFLRRRRRGGEEGFLRRRRKEERGEGKGGKGEGILRGAGGKGGKKGDGGEEGEREEERKRRGG